MYNELVMGRVGYGPSLYGPSWLWAEFVMGRVCYGPRCPVTLSFSQYVIILLTFTHVVDVKESHQTCEDTFDM